MDFDAANPLFAPIVGQAPWEFTGGGSLRNELTFRFGRAIPETSFSGREYLAGEYELEIVAPEWTLIPRSSQALPTVRSDDPDEERRRAIRSCADLGKLIGIDVQRLDDRFRIALAFEACDVVAFSHTERSWHEAHANDLEDDEPDEDDWVDLPSNTAVLQLTTPAGYLELYHDGSHTPPDRLLDPDLPHGELPTDRERIWSDFDPIPGVDGPRG